MTARPHYFKPIISKPKFYHISSPSYTLVPMHFNFLKIIDGVPDEEDDDDDAVDASIALLNAAEAETTTKGKSVHSKYSSYPEVQVFEYPLNGIMGSKALNKHTVRDYLLNQGLQLKGHDGAGAGAGAGSHLVINPLGVSKGTAASAVLDSNDIELQEKGAGVFVDVVSRHPDSDDERL